MKTSPKPGIIRDIAPAPLAHIVLSAAMALGFALPHAAAAQSPQSEVEKKGGSERLAPLVVSGARIRSADEPTKGYTADSSRGATKTDTPLIKTPQAVDAVTREQIEDQGARTINDALKYTPGVFTGLAGSSSRQTVMSLRGFPGGDVNNTFLDGLRLQNDPGAYSNIQIDPFFLERIDVVKGPSSMLYGRAQPGGLANFVTKKPLNQRKNLIRLQGGSFDTYGGGFDFTGPLPGKDIGSYRLVASAETSGTQYDVVKRERYTVMPEVSFNLSHATTLLLQAYIQRDPKGGFHGSVPYDLSVDGSRFGRTVGDHWVDVSTGFSHFDRDTNLFSYELTHDLNDNIKLRSRARYATVALTLKQVYQNGFDGNGPELKRYYSAANENLRAFSTDNNAQVDFITGPVEHRMLIGVGYQQRKNHVSNASGPASPLDPFNPDYNANTVQGSVNFAPSNERQLRQIGAYVQDQLTWNRWNAVLSGREDFLEREYTNGSDGSKAVRNDDAFAGRAALLYESRWGVSPYVSYSEAFNPNTYTPANGRVANPVRSHQYEVGLKYQPTSLNALFTLALYDLTQKNVQQRTQVTPIKFTNVGDVKSRGIELSAKADLTETLHLSAAYSRSHVAYQDDISHDGINIDAGKTFVRTPEDLASLWLAYDFPFGIRAGAGGRYVGSSYANTANTLKVPHYTLADAFVSFDLGEFSDTLDGASVKVNADNLFDKKHVEACFSEINCYYGSPRTITTTLDYRL